MFRRIGRRPDLKPRSSLETFTLEPQADIHRSVTGNRSSAGRLAVQELDGLFGSCSIGRSAAAAPNIVQGDLSIRGSSFGQALVLVDGLRMDDVHSAHLDMCLPLPFGSVNFSAVPAQLCGSDAVAGSINVITALPEHSDFRAGAGLGNFGVNQQSGSTALAWGKFDTEFGSERDFSSRFRPDRDYWTSPGFLRQVPVVDSNRHHRCRFLFQGPGRRLSQPWFRFNMKPP